MILYTFSRNSNQLKFYHRLKLAKNGPRKGSYPLPWNLCTDFQVLYRVTAQSNFIHSCLSSILRDIFRFISEFQIFFEKTCTFSCLGLDFFCDQYSLIITNFDYLQVATDSSIKFSNRFFFSNTSQCFWIYFQIPNIF